MQNLVTLASMNHGSAAQHNAAAYGVTQTAGGHYATAIPTSKALTGAANHGHVAAQYTTTAQHTLSSLHQQQQAQQHHLQHLHHQAMGVGSAAPPSYATHLSASPAGTTLCKYLPIFIKYF